MYYSAQERHMSEENHYNTTNKNANNKQESKSYSTIKVPDAHDSYLETTSGTDDNAANTQQLQQTCDKCGLTARNKEELQDHLDNAHRTSALD